MNQKGFTPILILVGVVILGFLGGGAYYLNKSKITSIPTPTQVISQPSPTLQYSVAIDQKINLKTYTNKKVGFSAQYSANYEDSSGNDFLAIDDKKIFKTDGCMDRPNFRIEVYITPTTDIFAKDIAQRKKEDKTWAGKITKQSETLLGGTLGEITDWTLGRCQDGATIDVVRNGYHIEINKSPLKGSEAEFNQILSTFKFTD